MLRACHVKNVSCLDARYNVLCFLAGAYSLDKGYKLPLIIAELILKLNVTQRPSI